MMPELAGDGLLVAGDAAGAVPGRRHLAGGRELRHRLGHRGRRGGRRGAAPRATRQRAGLAGYRRRLDASRSCCRTTRSCAARPTLVLSDRVQHHYPQIVCDMVERMFRVDNPTPEAGAAPHRCARSSAAASGVRDLRDARPRTRGRRLRTLRMTRRPPTPRWPGRVSFEDRMATVEFRVAPDAHIVVDGDACRGCTHPGVRGRLPGQPVRARRPTAASSSTTSSASSAAPATWSATPRAPSPGRYPEGGHGVVFRRS